MSSPPLYRVGNGVETGFSADDLCFQASSGFSIDTSLRVTRQLKNVRRQIEFQNRFMREQIREQIQRAFLAQEELILVQRELELAKQDWKLWTLNLEVQNWMKFGSIWKKDLS